MQTFLKRLTLYTVMLALLALPLLGLGVRQAEAAGQFQILNSNYELVDSKMKVTVDVRNDGSSQAGGAVAIGLDGQGNRIEVKGKTEYIMRDKTAVLEIILDSGSSIKSVEVQPIGNKSYLALLASGSRVNGDYLEVTGVVENGGSSQTAGIVAYGLDKAGRTVEVKAANAYIANHSSGSFNIQLKHKDLIDSVKVETTGEAKVITLLGHGVAAAAGKVTATASVENGGSSRTIGVVFEGYDKNGKLIETRTAQGYLANHYVGNFDVTFKAGSQVASVKAFATGKATDLELLSTGSRLTDGKWLVTSALENGGSSKTAGVVVYGFDAGGKLIEVRASSQYSAHQHVGTFETTLQAGSSVKKVRALAAGGYQNPKGWGYGMYQLNGKNFITGVVTNGSKGQTFTVKVAPYNSAGKSMSVKTSQQYVPSGSTASFQLSLDSGTASAKMTVYDGSGNVISMPNVSGIDVEIDGVPQSYEQPPVMVNGSVLVPMRGIFEALGSEVKWNGSTRTVTSEKNGVVIKLTIDSKIATIGGKKTELNTAPKVINQATMVPIRFVSEALGADVKWDSATSTVRITTK